MGSKGKGKPKPKNEDELDDDEFRIKYLKYKAKYMKLKAQHVGGDSESDEIDDHSSDLSNWDNQQEMGPVEFYSEVVAKYGKPTYCVNEPGGICKWLSGKTEKSIEPHEYLMLKDEFVPHIKPEKHHDFFYSVIKVYVPPDKFHDVIGISGSINYDPLLKHLRARCASMAANFATLKTAFDVIDGKESDYSKNINESGDKIEENEKFVMKKVKENQTKYAKELNEPFYKLDGKTI
jgi:hypothetical protein